MTPSLKSFLSDGDRSGLSVMAWASTILLGPRLEVAPWPSR